MAATDAAGTVVGEFRSALWHRGSPLGWGDRELELRSASHWRTRYTLADGERALATVEGKGLGKAPVRVTVDDPASVEPGLLLFAAFVVHGLAQDAATAAAAAP